jgi:hypothetical protein
MYHLINANIGPLLSTIEPLHDVRPYVWILEELATPSACQSAAFQQKFSTYWAMGAARLGTAFKTAYFSLLEESKNAPHRCNVENVAKHLFEVPVNSKEKKALQFSFATKLVHMVDPTLPVYDTRVESFYFLPRQYSGKHEVKLANLLCSYEFLIREYARVLRDGLLSSAIREFRRSFNPPQTYTEQKVIDTLIWKFVPMLQKGALREGTIVYT